MKLNDDDNEEESFESVPRLPNTFCKLLYFLGVTNLVVSTIIWLCVLQQKLLCNPSGRA